MDIPYAAGLFDAEGCVRIHRQVFRGSVRYDLRVLIQMTDPRPLIMIADRFGGVFSVMTPPKDPRHRQKYCWRMSAREAAGFLEQIAPFLKVKREEVELAIEFQQGVRRGNQKPLPPAEIARRETLARRIEALKHVVYDPADFGMVAKSGDSENRQSRAKQRGSTALRGRV